VTEAVTPVGAFVLVAAVAVVYQAIVPTVPVSTFFVVTAKVAMPAVPEVIVPDWAPSMADWTASSDEGDEPEGFEQAAKYAVSRTRRKAKPRPESLVRIA
jgi:hypothetical protein